MLKRTLQDWLAWQESLHLSEIDLGLERIGIVAKQLNILKPTFPIITVAGTNGKGSTVAFLASILQAQGYKVGAYTSPHLVHYNERIALNGIQANDQQIIEAFEEIDKARQPDKDSLTSLTYFEFSTLAAMILFSKQPVDVAILEVGLGGRLDAANLWDTSLAIITNIGIDHTDWLGDDRETIAVEKSGIMRESIPVICGDPIPPTTIKKEAKRIGAKLVQIDTDFSYEELEGGKWNFNNGNETLHLSKPSMAGTFQLNNAATAIAGLLSIKSQLPISQNAINKGLINAKVLGRLHIIQSNPEWLLDVAHNPHAATQLADYINANPIKGKTYALFSMLRDKDIQQVLGLMNLVIDEWHIVALEGSRGMSLDVLKLQFIEQKVIGEVTTHENFNDACKSLKIITKSEDRVVAFGSFLVVSQVLNNCN